MKRGLSEGIIPCTTRVQKSTALLRGTKHSDSVSDAEVKRRSRVGLGTYVDPINNAFDVLGITPKDWDMSQSLIILSVHALKVTLVVVPSPPSATPSSNL